ncbi:MAG: heavy metal translocating P-type ATPase metal-binding domain-containing protein [Vicingaceae bacterium]
MSQKTISKKTPTSCYHCGDDCLSTALKADDKVFCCQGCKTVYEILQSNDLCDYYELESKPGISPKTKSQKKFDYLEHESIIEELLDYQDDTISKVQFYLPQIHCSSCLWLLENLYKLNPAVQQSRVNFLKKEIYLTFNHHELSLRKLVELLASLGYEPSITLDQLKSERKKPISKRLLYQVGLAGFAFGNIMLLSLPEYFGFDERSLKEFASWFSWLNLALATPVAFYSGQDYFKSALTSLKNKRLNIDVPIAIGVLVLYIRSVYEVMSQTGAGYFDSLCGLLFFLLIGRIFQEKIYHQLSFERDYRSYFPISINKVEGGVEKSIPVQEIKKGDKIVIRNGELIPVDAYLIKGKANIDNSFATGESEPIEREIGSKLFAGGRQIGEAIILEVIRPLAQSKLTRLWSEHAARTETQTEQVSFSALTDKISQWFTPIILLIAGLSGLYHFQFGVGASIEVITAVLIVACPCALALAAPFTFGHAMRYLGRLSCYLREAAVIEQMAEIDLLIFDKTGTLTYGQNRKVNYLGEDLSEEEQESIQAILSQSNHPLSRIIASHLPIGEELKVTHFSEIAGKGLSGKTTVGSFRLGSASWLGEAQPNQLATSVFIELNGKVKGYFEVSNQYRKGLKSLLQKLSQHYQLSMISGDHAGQKEKLKGIFPKNSDLKFEQSPEDKLVYIKTQQAKDKQCMMIGDGLNDAGALLQSNVGVSIAENVNAFSPACDVILEADRFDLLAKILNFTKSCKRIVLISFVISFLYNAIGLAFAVQGLLSPVFAAILMPISSVTVVGFVSFAVWVKKVQ